MWGWPTVRGPLSELGFWKFSSSESTVVIFSCVASHKRKQTPRTIDQRGTFDLFFTEMGLTLGESESLIRLPIESSLSVEVLGSLFGESNGFLCVISSEPVQIGLVL